MARVRVFRSYLKTPFLILLVLEVCIIFISVYSATFLRFYDNPDIFFSNFDEIWFRAAVLTVVTPVVMLSTGLYQGHIREGTSGILLRLGISIIASGLIVILIFYNFPSLELGRGVMAIALAQSFFIIGTLRAVFLELVDTDTFKKRVLVYGAGETAAHIETKLRRKSDRRAFTVLGFMLLDHQKQDPAIAEKMLISCTKSLLDYSRENEVDEILVATSDIKAQIPVDELLQCKFNGIDVVDLMSFFEREAGQIRIDMLDPRWFIFSEGFIQHNLKESVKRVFDILASIIILSVSLPFTLLTVLAIWIEEGFKAPIFYHQLRVGKDGASFRVYKFRSMRTDAETGGKAIWASKVDSRVTKVGSIIRKTRIDEVPQIFNVLNGTMSFVGPRPERPEMMEQLEEAIPYYKDRHLVKPGITGWAQLMYPYGSSVNDSYQKQLYDMYYIKNRSLFLDFLILLQTVEVVLFGKGAR